VTKAGRTGHATGAPAVKASHAGRAGDGVRTGAAVGDEGGTEGAERQSSVDTIASLALRAGRGRGAGVAVRHSGVAEVA
jgi:hypothetical protein